MAFEGDDGEDGVNPWEDALQSDDEDDDTGNAAAKRQSESSTKDNILLLIDARGNMLDSNLDPESPQSFLACALSFAVEFMKVKCQRDPHARVGVILLGTGKWQAHLEMPGPGVYVLLPLRQPSVEDIRDMRKWSSRDGLRALDTLVNKFAPQGSVLPIDNGLWEASWIFNETLRPQDQRRMWLFTNDDSPRVSSKAAVLQRAKDAANMRATLHLWPLQAAGTPAERAFDPTLFWEDVLLVDEPDDAPAAGGAGSSSGAARGRIRPDEADADDEWEHEEEDDAPAGGAGAGASGGAGGGGAERRQRVHRFGHLSVPMNGNPNEATVREAIGRYAFPKRTYTRLCFDIMPNVTLAVSVYNSVIPKRKPTGHRVTAEHSLPVTMTRREIDPANGNLLDRRGTVKFHEIGGAKVFFMENEMKDLKTVTASGKGLKLLAFKPRSSVRGIDTLKHPYFLYPAEREITGSTATFRALHARMTARDVVGIARLQLRDATEPRIVALFPQLEELDESGKQRVPAGLVAVPLPYADDVRLMKAPPGALSGVEATEEQITAARAVVSSLSLEHMDFRRHSMRNPQLSKFWTELERQVLGAAVKEWDETDDSSAPAIEGMREAAGAEMQELVRLTGLRPDGDVSQLFWPTASKPAPSGSGVGSKRKRPAGAGLEGAESSAGTGDADGTAAKRARLPKKALVASTAEMSAEEAAVAAEFKSIWRAGGLASLTIPRLKTFCVAFGLKQSGKKDEVVARVEEHLQILFPAGSEDADAGEHDKGALGDEGDDDDGDDAAVTAGARSAGSGKPAKKGAVPSKARKPRAAAPKRKGKPAARRKGRADEWDDTDSDASDSEGRGRWSEEAEEEGDDDGSAASGSGVRANRTSQRSARAAGKKGAAQALSADDSDEERQWSEED